MATRVRSIDLPGIIQALLIFVCFVPAGFSQDGPPDQRRDSARSEQLEETRRVLDRVVICFDPAGFLKEISAWDEHRFWPVLLWDPVLSPKFLGAFQAGQVLLASYAKLKKIRPIEATAPDGEEETEEGENQGKDA